jgi:hypothetical protein
MTDDDLTADHDRYCYHCDLLWRVLVCPRCHRFTSLDQRVPTPRSGAPAPLLPVTSAREHAACPYCDRLMSYREKCEQGCCTDCANGVTR